MEYWFMPILDNLVLKTLEDQAVINTTLLERIQNLEEKLEHLRLKSLPFPNDNCSIF